MVSRRVVFFCTPVFGDCAKHIDTCRAICYSNPRAAVRLIRRPRTLVLGSALLLADGRTVNLHPLAFGAGNHVLVGNLGLPETAQREIWRTLLSSGLKTARWRQRQQFESTNT